MRAVVLSGGLTHDFVATTACLRGLLEGADCDVEVHTDVDDAFGALPGAELLVVNALRWTMTGPGVPDRYRDLAPQWAASPSPSSRAALSRHLAGGGGVLGMHTASICFDDWPAWGEVLGGTWEWGRSGHPALGPAIRVRSVGVHPLLRGVEPFDVVDEVYGDLNLQPGVTALLEATHPRTPDSPQPVLWTREYGGGRVAYDALGHHPPSYEAPAHRAVLRRTINWLTGRQI
ncbi:MAG: ThuA domain-containing protein [Sporichthyaceae bacterium]